MPTFWLEESPQEAINKASAIMTEVIIEPSLPFERKRLEILQRGEQAEVRAQCHLINAVVTMGQRSTIRER